MHLHTNICVNVIWLAKSTAQMHQTVNTATGGHHLNKNPCLYEKQIKDQQNAVAITH